MPMRSSPGLAICAAALLAGSATAQMAPPASSDDVVAAVRACAAVTGPSGVDADRLAALGWHAATASPSGVRFFGSPPNHALISVEGSGAGATCAVSAGMQSLGETADVIGDLQTALGTALTQGSKGPRWSTSGNVVDLEQREGPGGSIALRIDVRPKSGAAK